MRIVQILSIVLTGIGLLLQVALRTQPFTDLIILRWPSYLLAMDGLQILQDFKYPFQITDQSLNIGILNIDQPSWQVILDFIQSEIAIRKSDRGEQEYMAVQTPQPPSPEPAQPPPPESSTAPAQPLTQGSAKDQLVVAPKINFERIKSIISFRIGVNILAGGKSVVPPYRLAVLWPPNVARILYEFVTFEEFRLDLRKMIIERLDGYTKWLSLGSFVCTLILSGLRRVISRRESRGTAVSP